MAASGITVFANNPSTTATGTGAGGSILSTDTTFTVASSSEFPVASSTAVPPTQFCIADPAVPTEVIWVTAISGTTWTVARGQEGTSAQAHAANATFYQIVSAGDLTSMKQASGAVTAPATVANTATETVVCSYQPVVGEIVAGTTFELIATGVMRASVTASLLLWTIRWGGVGGTRLLVMPSGTSNFGTTGATNPGNAVCSSFSSAMSVTSGVPFDVNGTVTFVSTTSAIANLNFWFGQGSAQGCGAGVACNGSAVTGLTAPPGGGPLVLTAKWSSATSVVGLTAPAPLAYRAA